MSTLARQEKAVAKQKVSFQRDNLKIIGNLFTPPNFDQALRYPTLIVQGAVTMVKENAADNYARLSAEKGFLVLDFDYASYGESEGCPARTKT